MTKCKCMRQSSRAAESQSWASQSNSWQGKRQQGGLRPPTAGRAGMLDGIRLGVLAPLQADKCVCVCVSESACVACVCKLLHTYLCVCVCIVLGHLLVWLGRPVLEAVLGHMFQGRSVLEGSSGSRALMNASPERWSGCQTNIHPIQHLNLGCILMQRGGGGVAKNGQCQTNWVDQQRKRGGEQEARKR